LSPPLILTSIVMVIASIPKTALPKVFDGMVT